VAIHCKAGLGRTATLIALWAMRTHKFPAGAFIAWCRLCRPGSVLGPQQHYLHQMEPAMFARCGVQLPESPLSQPLTSLADMSIEEHARLGSMSPVGIFGEQNQGERLTNAKRKNSASLTPTKTPRSPRQVGSPRKEKGLVPAKPPPLQI
jgi:cell division cycle 14